MLRFGHLNAGAFVFFSDQHELWPFAGLRDVLQFEAAEQRVALYQIAHLTFVFGDPSIDFGHVRLLSLQHNCPHPYGFRLHYLAIQCVQTLDLLAQGRNLLVEPRDLGLWHGGLLAIRVSSCER
jgi:hypothetical protein